MKFELPAIGEPIVTAIPWNISKSPKALVSRSRPKSSTVITERRAAKHAIKLKIKVLIIYGKIISRTYRGIPIENPKIAP